MPDEIYLTNEGGKDFTPAPDGQAIGVCVDAILLGDCVDKYQDQPARIVKKAALVFQINVDNPDTEKPFEVSVEKTITFGPKSGLRKFLEDWRGKAYQDAEIPQGGVPLHKVVGQCGVLTIEHKVSGQGRTYAKVRNISPLMKGLPKIAARDYTRSEHWEKKKTEYAEKVAEFRALNAPAKQAERPMAAIVADVESDNLPF